MPHPLVSESDEDTNYNNEARKQKRKKKRMPLSERYNMRKQEYEEHGNEEDGDNVDEKKTKGKNAVKDHGDEVEFEDNGYRNEEF